MVSAPVSHASDASPNNPERSDSAASTKLATEFTQDPAGSLAILRQSQSQPVAASANEHLPTLSVATGRWGANERAMQAVSGQVAGEERAALPYLVKGACDELVNHPLKVAEDFGIGVAEGVGATVAVVGIASVSVPVAIGTAAVVGVGGAAYGIYKAGTAMSSWLNAGATLENASSTKAQKDGAASALEAAGHGAVDAGAGLIGGLAGIPAGAGVVEAAPLVAGAAKSGITSLFGSGARDVATTGASSIHDLPVTMKTDSPIGKPTVRAEAIPTNSAIAKPILRTETTARDSAIAKPPLHPKATSTDKTSPPEQLPPGSVEHLSARIDQFINSRQDQFDIVSAKQRIQNLGEQGDEFKMEVFIQSMTRGEPIRASELADPAAMESKLKNYPDLAKQYESYLKDLNEQTSLQTAIESELSARRAGLSNILNDEAPSLFPKGTQPKYTVRKLSPNDSADAAYANGTVFLKDEDLEDRGLLGKVLTGNRLPGLIVHEMKHGEQDGLLIRHYIDQVTDGDTTGRALTETEMAAVNKKFAASNGRALPDEMIAEINELRDGQVLSAEDSVRAEAIQTGHLSQQVEGGAQDSEKARLEHLKAELNFLQDDEGSGPAAWSLIAAPDDYLQDLLGGKVPSSVQELQKVYAAKNGDRSANVGTPTYDAEFAQRARQVLQKALEEAIEEAHENVDSGYNQYRSWEHELESWSVGTEADDRVGAGKQSFESMFSKLFGAEDTDSEMVQNPANLSAFEYLVQAREDASPALSYMYNDLIALLADEKGSLSDPATLDSLIQRFTNFPEDEAEQVDSTYYTDSSNIAAQLREFYSGDEPQ